MRDQCVDVHVILPTAPDLNYSHLHAGQIHQRGDLHARSCRAARVLDPLKRIKPAKERYFDHTTATVYKSFQVIPLAMDPDIRVSLIQIPEERQPRPQPVGIETRRGKEIKVLGGAVAELERQAGATIEYKFRRHSIQLRPQQPLRRGQDIQTRLKGRRAQSVPPSSWFSHRHCPSHYPSPSAHQPRL